MTETGIFWNWAVAVYAKPGVAEVCLDLQDTHGQNVPLLLWAAWAVTIGCTLDDAMVTEAEAVAQVWADEVVSPLRTIRRRLKTVLSVGDIEQRLALREKIKAVELQSEHTLMGELERLTIARNFEKYDLNHMVKFDVAAAIMRVAHGPRTNSLQMAADRLAEALIKS